MATATGREAGGSPDWLVSLVSGCLNLPAHEIDVRAPLSRHGLDSLAAAELTTAIAGAIGRDLPDSLLVECPDIESLHRFLASGRPASAHPLDRMLADAALPPEIAPSPAAPPAERWQSALLTGATGFLGAYLLRALLRGTPARIACLVRPSGAADARARVRRSLEAHGFADPSFEARVQVVEGDVSRPRLGLPAGRFDELCREVDVVYHAAAEVNWVHPYEALRDVNVLGTRELLRLACAGRPKPFHFVSTMAVCYSAAGPPEVSDEDDRLPEPRGIHLGYAQSKWVAEALARAASARGLPVAIYRPSFVSGDARSGASNAGDFLSSLLKGCIQMGSAPDLDWTVDACPVDYVADAIVRLSRRGRAPLGVFHLANPRPRHWRECVLWLNLFGYPVRLVPYAAWLGQLDADSRRPGHALRALRPFFLARPAGQDGLTLPELYEEPRKSRVRSDSTRRALAALSPSCPPLSAQLLDRYVSSFIRRGFLPPVARSPARPGASGAARLDAAFFGRVLRRHYRDETLRVTDASAAGGEGEHSIITELTSWKYGGAAGLSRHRLVVRSRSGAPPGPLEVIVKRKPKDDEVIAVGERVARLCGDAVGRAYARSRHRIGLTGCHLRELAVYAQEDDRFRRHAPTLFGSVRDDERRSWMLVLESLTGVELMDTADDVRGWRREHVEAALRGIAEVHAVWYGREADLLARPWLGHVQSASGMAEMADLWSALADHAAPWFSGWIGPGARPLQRRLISGVGQWWQPLEATARTLIHNDFNPRNLALRRTDAGLRLCAYDWELATLGAPQHDLAELLCFVLTANASMEEVRHYLEVHRTALERATGLPIDAGAWRLGFRLSLYDLILNRLPMYALVHRFRRLRFLERVVRTWRALYDLFPPS